MNSYFSLKEKIYDLTERYPELIDLLVSTGFENMADEKMRRTMGKNISLESALKSKGIDVDLFEERIIHIIEERTVSLTDVQREEESPDIRLEGILPCPVRLQILEKVENWIEQQNLKVSYHLPAASMGLDWLREKVEKAQESSELSDVYLSNGFSLFFEEDAMGRFLKEGVFKDLTGVKKLNKDFSNEHMELEDPRRQYSIIAVVPAVFMVNEDLLKGREFPKRWSDLLKPEFENSVAIPISDLDLFHALLLSIYKEHGEKGVEKLGKSMLSSMHPAQMVKLGVKKQEINLPVVTVMPYFFTHVSKQGGPMKAVWPEDGAIISPAFLVTKKDSKEKSQPLIDFMFSKEMGMVFSEEGKFPSTHPDVDNGLSEDQKFYWVGWDFLYENNIGELLMSLEDTFFQRTVKK